MQHNTSEFAELEARRRQNRTPTPNDAYATTTPAERLHYAAQIEEAIGRYKADIRAFNARIPLSPLEQYSPDRSYEEQYMDEDTNDEEIARRIGAQIWNRYRRDHAEACGGAMTPVPQQPFRFLDLPSKLRTIIYGMILRVPGSVTQMEPDGSANDEEGPIDTRIFAVNKQIHEEATEAFFRENVVAVSLHDDGFLGLPPPMFRDDASDIQRAHNKIGFAA
ncbi:MAG: hypothetical protein Q9208_007362 [Pyrenodesmia sp. 3 TL-2023]